MNSEDLKKLIEAGVNPPSCFKEKKYILVESDSPKGLLVETIKLILEGKEPVMLIKESFPKEKIKREAYTKNIVELKHLMAISRHFHLITLDDKVMYSTLIGG